MIFNTKELSAAVSKLAPIVPPTTPAEIMKWMHVTPEKIRVYSGDIPKATKVVNGNGNGSVMVEARTFGQILSTIKSEEVEIYGDGKTATIIAGTSEFNLPQLVDEFPEPDQNGLQKLASINGQKLSKAVKDCLVSVNDKDTRYTFTSIAISWPLMYSTDGGTASITRLDKGEPDDNQHLLSSSTAKKLCFSDDEAIDVYVSDTGIGFKSDETGMFCRKSEGFIPKLWKAEVVPEEFDTLIDCDPEELHSALKQASITTNPESEGFDFSFGESSISVSTSGADKGRTTVSVNCTSEGPEKNITLHGGKLLRYMSRTKKNNPLTIKIAQGKNGTVAVFTQDDSYTFMIVEILKDA